MKLNILIKFYAISNIVLSLHFCTTLSSNANSNSNSTKIIPQILNGNPVIDLDLHSEQNLAISVSSSSSQFYLWDYDKGMILRIFSDPAGAGKVTEAKFSKVSERIVSGHMDGFIRIWDYNGNLIKKIPGLQKSTGIFTVSPKRDEIAFVAETETAFNVFAKIIDFDGDLITKITLQQSGIIAYLSFAPGNSVYVINSQIYAATKQINHKSPRGTASRARTGH